MKLNLPDDGERGQRPSRIVQTGIRLNTYAVVGNGLCGCLFIDTGIYIAAAITILAMLGHLFELVGLWSHPCNSSR